MLSEPVCITLRVVVIHGNSIKRKVKFGWSQEPAVWFELVCVVCSGVWNVRLSN